MDVVALINRAKAILTEGAVVTRLVYEHQLEVPESAAFVHLFNPAGRAALTTIYRSYLAIAAEYNVPMQVGTATWRAHPEALQRLGFNGPDDLMRVNREAVTFLRELRAEMGLESSVYIAGVIGPQYDGYDPAVAPGRADALRYHQAQVDCLAQSGVDLFYAPTFASTEELIGVAQALATTGIAYVLAPIIDSHGRLRDGIELGDAIAQIDAAASVAPLFYAIGCVHPKHLREASQTPAWPLSNRVIGLQGNASELPPEVLEKLDHVAQGEQQCFVDEMMKLHEGGLKIIGGCCGTSEGHIRALAQRIVSA
ncbi:homocysteine S-methyltransferase family protein [Pseudomonas sp. SDO528_S397]